MVAHAVSCTYNRHTTPLVPSSSMSNISQRPVSTPQTMRASRPGPQAAPGQLRRPRSACPASFPHRRTLYIVSEHPPNDTRSTKLPRSHAPDDGSPAPESDTTSAPSTTDSLPLMLQPPWHLWLSSYRYPSPPWLVDSDRRAAWPRWMSPTPPRQMTQTTQTTQTATRP
jgi:hypothetical protein